MLEHLNRSRLKRRALLSDRFFKYRFKAKRHICDLWTRYVITCIHKGFSLLPSISLWSTFSPSQVRQHVYYLSSQKSSCWLNVVVLVDIKSSDHCDHKRLWLLLRLCVHTHTHTPARARLSRAVRHRKFVLLNSTFSAVISGQFTLHWAEWVKSRLWAATWKSVNLNSQWLKSNQAKTKQNKNKKQYHPVQH